MSTFDNAVSRAVIDMRNTLATDPATSHLVEELEPTLEMLAMGLRDDGLLVSDEQQAAEDAAKSAELEEDEDRNQAIRELAKQYAKEGEIEFDDGCLISEGEDSLSNGAYVQAWVWVSFEGTPLDKGEEDED